MKTITYEQFLSFHPCWLGDSALMLKAKAFSKLCKNWSALDILALDVKADEKLWLVLRPELIDEPTLGELSCRFAEAVLKYITDDSVRQVCADAIIAKRKWMRGEITRSELRAASCAAHNAADAAYAAARDAAYDADARAAAYAAARDAAYDADARAAASAAAHAACAARAACAAGYAARAAARSAGSAGYAARAAGYAAARAVYAATRAAADAAAADAAAADAAAADAEQIEIVKEMLKGEEDER